MAQNAAIVVPDAQGTPVNHTFTPVKIDRDIASYKNYATATDSGRETLTFRMEDGKSTLRKVTLVLKVPRLITETINGVTVPSVPDYATAKAEVMVPKSWGITECENVSKMLAGALQNTLVVAGVKQGEFVY